MRSRKAVLGLFRRRSNEVETVPEQHPVFPVPATNKRCVRLARSWRSSARYSLLVFERTDSLVVQYLAPPLPTHIRLDVSRAEVNIGFHEAEYSAADLLEIVDEVRGRRAFSAAKRD